MKTRDKLGIKYGGIISRWDIKPGDVIELDLKGGDIMNRRFVVDRIIWGNIYFDNNSYCFDLSDSSIIGVIRWYPTNEELVDKFGGRRQEVEVDVPDFEWEINPVFTSGMIAEYSHRETASIMLGQTNGSGEYVLVDTMWWNFNKRWILRDTLKFYSLNNGMSYFI